MSGPSAGVTVVIPAWDRYVEFLSDAVDSVRRSDTDVPIVVVDNASSVPLPLLEGCELVRAPTRLSAGAARNLGLERVTTEYVVFLDADDMLLEGTLPHLHGQISANADLAICSTLILDGATGERHRGPRRFVTTLVQAPRILAFADCAWSLLPIQGCAILRTAQVRESGGYADADSGEDWVLAVSLLWRGAAAISPRLGLLYRAPEHPLHRSARTASQLRASARLVRERMRTDAAVPSWARVLVPVIGALQLGVIYLARPVYRAVRSVFSRRSNIR
jgi:glycosyltransferase involved in cell wall biosynthesis